MLSRTTFSSFYAIFTCIFLFHFALFFTIALSLSIGLEIARRKAARLRNSNTTDGKPAVVAAVALGADATCSEAQTVRVVTSASIRTS